MNNFQSKELLEEDARYQLANVYDVWIATRSKLRGYSTVVFDRLQRVLVFPEEVSEEGEEEEGEEEEEEEGEKKEKENAEIRSVVFVRGSGQCVGKAIQVAEYVGRRFMGGKVYRQVVIGTAKAGTRVFHGHDERTQPSFTRDRPMISIGLSLDQKRLKKTVQLLEKLERDMHMAYAVAPPKLKTTTTTIKAYHRIAQAESDSSREEEEEEEESEEEEEEESEEKEEEEEEEEQEGGEEQEGEEEQKFPLLNDSHEFPRLQREEEKPTKHREVVEHKEVDVADTNDIKENDTKKEEGKDSKKEGMAESSSESSSSSSSSSSSELDEKNISPVERRASSYESGTDRRRQKKLHGEKTTRGSSTPPHREKHV